MDGGVRSVYVHRKTHVIENGVTERVVVSSVSQPFDPDGCNSSVTVTGKIIIQDLWRLQLEWDEKLPVELEERFKNYWSEIKNLEKFKIPRWIGARNNEKVELHGFADASEAAYGAVIYARIEHMDGQVSTNLLVSKTRVAPIKKLTIPRLELAAGELLARLITDARRSLEWDSTDYTLWSDSFVVLHWLRKLPRDLKTFVGNRVAAIQDSTEINKWKHVSTMDNPADLLSRGLGSSELVNNQLWLKGPTWLSEPREQWPIDRFEQAKVQDINEVQQEVKVNVVSTHKEPLRIFVPKMGGRMESVPLVEYESKLERILNVLVYVKRFIDAFVARYLTRDRARRAKRIRKPRNKNIVVPLPTNDEKSCAMEYLLKESQEQHFHKELAMIKKENRLPEHSKIESLRPILDESGLIRVGGRITNAEGEYEMRHQVIIARGSRLAHLIIDFAHRQTKHGAVQVMTHYIRQKYWIPRMRDELRKFLHKCVVCVRYSYRLEQQLMSDLPVDRVQAGKPFLQTGLDYAGPFSIRTQEQDDHVIKTKCWVAIFVCMKTRAIHIDMVLDLTTQSFIACYERFVGRRGRCERIYSDNGTTFVGAAKMIKNAIEAWREQGVLEHLNMKGTEWHFMVPAAPHQGGIYEAAVKSMKYHLTRIVGHRTLAHDQFSTLLVGIEAILNSRPLYPLSDDPADVQALSPGHFLVGEPLVLPPPFAISEQAKSEGTKLWRERQTMLQHFWNRWQVDYLNSLQERKKWRRERENLKIGQLVLLKAENFPPAQWALGRVDELIVSKDGLVRSVVLRTQTSRLARPVQKVCMLPVEPVNPEPSH